MASSLPDMLTFQEFAMQGSLPLATIQQTMLSFCVTGPRPPGSRASAVNADAREPRNPRYGFARSTSRSRTASVALQLRHDILVEAEEIFRVICRFDLREPGVGRARVCLVHTLSPFVLQKVDVHAGPFRTDGVP